ncbi:MAG: aminotransferase class V-fold PLP-dependent enzyme [Chloroflexi bacterium]|nr:aminotransferase class V-fold PLP-dependent enzyme [Chloroflexota bacterium]
MSVSAQFESVRAQIPSLRSLIYMNTGWQGPSPRCVVEAVQEALETEASAPTAPPVQEQRLDIFRRARRVLAELINASPEEVSLQQNSTEGINIVLNGLCLSPDDEVITCSLEHPSVIVPSYYARERRGANLKIVRLSAADSPDDVLAKFQEAVSPRTRLLVLSHITYGTGMLLPARELAGLAHARGAYLLLDAAQSVGQIPVDVRALDCDFCAFPGHKWLLAPAGTGALYVRRDLVERLEAPKVAHRASAYYNFAGRFQPKADNIDKFELTTLSVPLLAGLLAAVDFIRGIGLDAIAERARSLAAYATAKLSEVPELRLVSPPAADVSSGLVSFALPRVSPQNLTACLWEWGRIVARTVPDAGCTRLSLHVFNTEREVDRVIPHVERLSREGTPRQTFPTAQVEWEAMNEL